MYRFYALDVKDRKILSELDHNARQSNNQIGKKAGLSKEVVKYRIDRMTESGLILRFHTIINYFKVGIMKYKLYLRLRNASKEKLEEIGNYFCHHQKTEWVALTTGRWDIIVGFLVHNVNEFDDEVQEAANLFASFIHEKAVTTTLYLAHQEREFLQRSPLVSRVVYHTTQDVQEKIDAVDETILQLLANNARMPVTGIAHLVKTTPRIVQYHIKELERKKIILAYKVHLEPKVLGRIFCKALLTLQHTTEKRLQSFITYARSLPGVLWPQRVMGSWDFEIDFELESYDQFQDIILMLKEKFSDIISDHDFCITSKEFKLDLFPGCLREL